MTSSDWKVCPRCQAHIVNGGVKFSHRPDLTYTPEYLSQKVCQWAYAADERAGTLSPLSTKPLNCINPAYNSSKTYRSPLDDVPSLSDAQS